MSGWAWLFFCFCSRYHGYLLVLLVKGRMLTICSLHAESVRIETMEWIQDGTASHTRQTQKHHLQTKRCKATSLHWTALYFGREMNQTQQLYHHRFGYTLWERNKHNIEEMKNKHKYKTLIKIRNIVNNRFYPLTVAWRKNIWAEQVRSQCCMMYVDLSVTHGRVLTGALTFSRQCRVDQQ